MEYSQRIIKPKATSARNASANMIIVATTSGVLRFRLQIRRSRIAAVINGTNTAAQIEKKEYAAINSISVPPFQAKMLTAATVQTTLAMPVIIPRIMRIVA